MSEYSVKQQVHLSDTNLNLVIFKEESFGLLGTEEKTRFPSAMSHPASRKVSFGVKHISEKLTVV